MAWCTVREVRERTVREQDGSREGRDVSGRQVRHPSPGSVRVCWVTEMVRMPALKLPASARYSAGNEVLDV